jgi:hypothetical protein
MVIKSRMIRWMEHAVCMREMRYAHKTLTKKLGTLQLGDLHAQLEEIINWTLEKHGGGCRLNSTSSG